MLEVAVVDVHDRFSSAMRGCNGKTHPIVRYNRSSTRLDLIRNPSQDGAKIFRRKPVSNAFHSCVDLSIRRIIRVTEIAREKRVIIEIITHSMSENVGDKIVH